MSEGIDLKHQGAKKYSLGLPKYASIEFPLNVINDDKAIELIGGTKRIKESLVEKNVQLQLRLRPNDPYQHPIHSEVSTSENLLVKVLLPKGELLKHKNNIAKAIDANKDSYHFEPVAIIDKSFRFRELADFQVNTLTNDLLQKTTDAFFGNDFEKLQNFRNFLSGKDKYDTQLPLDLPPFSTFSKVKMPFSYNFSNNKGTAVRTDDGSLRLVNTKQPVKVRTSFVSWDAPAPQHPSPELTKHLQEAKKIVKQQLSEGKIPMNVIKNSNNYQLVECVKLLEKLFDQKPVWLRRHLYTITPENWKNTFKYALAYVAYSTRTGPWKQSYIKFGVDPKQSDAYALFQTERFRVHTTASKNMEEDEEVDNTIQTMNENSGTSTPVDKDAIRELPADFIFTGTNLPKISTFQLCDIKDPQLTSLLTRESMVSEVTERDGWFESINLVQLRLIMKYKLTCLAAREPISQSRLDQVREMAINRYHATLEQLKNKKEDSSGDETEDGGDEDDDEGNEKTVDDDGGVEEEDEEQEQESIKLEGLLRARFEKTDPQSLSELLGLLRQEDIMDIDS